MLFDDGISHLGKQKTGPNGSVEEEPVNADVSDQVNTAESDDPNLADEEWEAELDLFVRAIMQGMQHIRVLLIVYLFVNPKNFLTLHVCKKGKKKPSEA